MYEYLRILKPEITNTRSMYRQKMNNGLMAGNQKGNCPSC